MTTTSLLDWMLDTDPALRWQVERDLADAPAEVWQATRARVATEGFGARTLALQDADGQWAGGAYFPTTSGLPDPGDEGQPWTATSWALTDLRLWGLDADRLGDTAARIAASSRWEYDDLPYWGGEVDVCINAVTLANGGWLGVDVVDLARWFPEHQLSDGGWNCEWVEGSTRSSFHSTINALIGLLDYEQRTGRDERLSAARQRGEEYLLDRHLLHRKSTGEAVGDWTATLRFPFRWPYSALKALDYFRAAAPFDGRGPDPRLAEAVELVRSAQQADGRWLQGGRMLGKQWFEVDVPAGEPSPWLTFYATRSLDWWDAASGG